MQEAKVYVDELPKSCWDCPMLANKDSGEAEPYCVLTDLYLGDYEHCPLIDIKTHDRGLVKEVCEKIKQDCWRGGAILEDDYYKVPVEYLENLQKEENSD